MARKTRRAELSKNDMQEILRVVNGIMAGRSMSECQRNALSKIVSGISEIESGIGEIRNNCAVCAIPWRKAKGEVYCYGKDDEYHEHAAVIDNPEQCTCCNFKMGRKTRGWCGYEWGCAFREDDGKCGNENFCRLQTTKRNYDAIVENRKSRGKGIKW